MLISLHEREALRTTLQTAFDFAESQVKALLAKYSSDYYPMYTVGGQFGHDRKRWTHWCDGFYPGMMFLFAKRSGQSKWLDKAVSYAKPLESRQYDRAVHDLGFLFFSTHLRWLELGGPADHIEPLLIQAGRTMAMRFMERGQYLRSFVEPASLFIDIMMNVGTLFYSGLKAGDAHVLDIGHRHCLTTRRTIVRGDGSTSHEAIFDLETGECLRQTTHQGYRGDSCWSRGLAWSLYGFTR
ncbi:MAG TPA: glycoside hydrolase family 88 protein, partial [Blastocatellia bacterium]|nr:glycoside hydrolase family 88 protein [Blastocatellia bacterium]